MATGSGDDRAAFVPILVGNLLPLAGIAFLGWRLPFVLFVYWVEIGLLVVTYSGLALFVRRKPRTERRSITPPSISVPFLNTRSGTIRPFERLPPIYRRNVPYAIGLLGWGLGLWWCLSFLMIVQPSQGTPLVWSSEEGIFLESIVAIVSPALLITTMFLFASQLVQIRREFLGEQRYERLSAPMIAEIPIRVIVFWFLLTVFAQLIYPILLWPLFALFDSRTVTELGISSLVVAGNVTIEWSTLKARRLEEPDGFTG
ncbi:DUF6498-containing protein [Natrinema sp. 1APR25-10V2]|uniref:DUF6498-containing protein n=1 Tax=Natrinema sp. 1APR25-10V2 TaxID=2951081 RepID=UPI002874BDD4|nr:DUF6498-containing protein [Natrinema sp. 1APR25-10V2]MDS0475885.1 DUF6498-containing protein [Natrinema sp. 1APR25-10V2]